MIKIPVYELFLLLFIYHKYTFSLPSPYLLSLMMRQKLLIPNQHFVTVDVG